MTDFDTTDIPEAHSTIGTRPLFVMRLAVRPIITIGAVAGSAIRRIGIVPGGQFMGERLSGEVLEGGNDWQNVRGDGSLLLDVRLILKTEDGALICMTYRGIRRGSSDVLSRIDRGEVVDPASYYFRTNPLFETSAPKYEWLNGIICVGAGHRVANGVVYSVFEVL